LCHGVAANSSRQSDAVSEFGATPVTILSPSGPVNSSPNPFGREACPACIATREGFVSGLNTIFLIGALVAFAGAAAAMWLVREHEIERDHPELDASLQPESA